MHIYTHTSETGRGSREISLFLSRNVDIDTNSFKSKQKHGAKRKNTANRYFYVSAMKHLHKIEKARKSILYLKSQDFTFLPGFYMKAKAQHFYTHSPPFIAL